MTFQYKIFPELRLKHGVEKTINDPVGITGNGNREIRRKINKVERYSWTIPARNLTQSDMQAVIDFSRAVKSSMDSFLYLDPTAPYLVDYPLTKVYANGQYTPLLYHSGLHPILNLNTGGSLPQFDTQGPTIVIKKNGVPITWTDVSTEPSFDPTTIGRSDLPRTTKFDLSVPVGAGDVLTYTGPIYHTVRFDSMISYRISAMKKQTTTGGACDVVPTVSELGDIKLIEVFEYEGM